MNFPILSSITFLPLIGAFFIFLTRSEKNQSDKNSIYLSLFTSFTNFFLALFLWYSFDPTTYDFQFVEENTWISGFIKFKFKKKYFNFKRCLRGTNWSNIFRLKFK